MSAPGEGAKGAIARWLARGYVAGPTEREAIAVAHALSTSGLGCTIGYWDEPGAEPRAVMDRNVAAVDALAAAGVDGYLSLKPKPLGFDPELLGEIAAAAAAKQVRMHFDSLEPAGVDRSLALTEVARAHGATVGFTLPGRWRRSIDDARRVAELGLPVRVVKGERTEEGHPAPVGSADDAGYLAVVDAVAGAVPLAAVATHDPRLARTALERLAAKGTPAELELLFGFPLQPSLEVARAVGVPARVYIGYGYPWLPYGLRDLRLARVRRWLLRDAIVGRRGRQPPP